MFVLDTAAQERVLGRTIRDVAGPDDLTHLRGQRALVTGAGGSVGSELCRQLAACGVSRLTLADHSEYALFRIDTEIRRLNPSLDVVSQLCDVTRPGDIRLACAAAAPHVVYHAAAYKHVTMAERAIVPAARVNVIGTAETSRAAKAAGARFVLISSDKAAQPRSVMGATKRVAELVALATVTPRFRPIVVRFGNILGSSGSIVEIMLDALNTGAPIPITDPDCTRYFMTASEAVALVLKADHLATRPEVFWLDMGEPVRLGDLADRMMGLAIEAGLHPAGFDVIGLRPGEKMREELTTHGLAMTLTTDPRVLSARQRGVPAHAVAQAVRQIRRSCSGGDPENVIRALTDLVDDYAPHRAVAEWHHTRLARGGKAPNSRAKRVIARRISE
jgi:FlaA1/EpsC-like NDP-sugar epimerase